MFASTDRQSKIRLHPIFFLCIISFCVFFILVDFIPFNDFLVIIVIITLALQRLQLNYLQEFRKLEIPYGL